MEASIKNAVRFPSVMGDTESLLSVDAEVTAISYDDYLSAVNSLAYASTTRVMFQMLLFTGCRGAELENMRPEDLHGNVLYWRVGKNQKGYRKEILPSWFIDELVEYRRTHRVPLGRFFNVNYNTFARYFNMKERPKIGGRWRNKGWCMYSGQWREVYKLQLKGLRKSFQSIIFAYQMRKWGDASVALEMTSKRIKHKSVHTTAYHYINNLESVQAEKFIELFSDKPVVPAQRLLLDF